MPMRGVGARQESMPWTKSGMILCRHGPVVVFIWLVMGLMLTDGANNRQGGDNDRWRDGHRSQHPLHVLPRVNPRQRRRGILGLARAVAAPASPEASHLGHASRLQGGPPGGVMDGGIDTTDSLSLAES